MHIKYNSEWCTSLIGVSMTLLSPNFCHSPRLTCNGSDSLQNLSIKYWNAMHSSLCLTVEVLYGLYSASSLNNYWAPLLTLQVKHFSQWQAPSLCLPPPPPPLLCGSKKCTSDLKAPIQSHPPPPTPNKMVRRIEAYLAYLAEVFHINSADDQRDRFKPRNHL